MSDTIWTTPADKRQAFDDQFANLVNNYVPTYKGGQPIMTWHSDRVTPVVHTDFLAHLPEYIRQKVNELIQSVN